jgi:hypothetical protein
MKIAGNILKVVLEPTQHNLYFFVVFYAQIVTNYLKVVLVCTIPLSVLVKK